MIKLPLHYLPISIGSSLILGALPLWGLSVYLGHSELFFQYVSDLGSSSPEANVFTWLMCSHSVILVIMSLVRYGALLNYTEANKDLTYTNPVDEKIGLKGYNQLSLATGLGIGAGTIFVGANRTSEGLVILFFHGCGANLLFGGTFFDMIWQSRVAYLTGQPRLGLFRALCSITMAGFLGLCGIFGLWSALALGIWEIADYNVRMHWHSGQPGYWPHVISALMEWLAILPAVPYFWLFVPQFKTYSLSIRSAIICQESPIVSSGLYTINID